jgi:hypothetical protein
LNIIFKYWPYLLCLLLGLIFITGNILGLHLEFVPGDFIDGRFNNYILEHGFSYLGGNLPSYWNAPFIYPEKDVITYSDNLLGTVPIYAIFRWFGAPFDTAFQLWTITITILNYAACAILLQYLFKNHYASSIGAFVFAFSIALQSQVGHAQTFPRFAIPLVILALLIFFLNKRPFYFFVALLLWVYQMYCGIYLGMLLLTLIFIMLVVNYVLNANAYHQIVKNQKWLFQLFSALVINVMLLLPLMLPYLERAKQLGLHNYENVRGSIPTPLSFFFSWSGSYLWDFLNDTCIDYPAFWDHQIFAGGLATLAIVIVVLRAIYLRLGLKNKQSEIGSQHQTLFWSALCLFLVFMRFGNYSLYQLVYQVPGFAAMKALQRIINIELVFFSIALACLLKSYVLFSGLRNALIFVLLAFILTLDNFIYEENTHHRSKAESRERIITLKSKMNHLPQWSVISYEPDSMISAPMDYQLDAMLASQQLKLFCINGYTGNSPNYYSPYWVKPNKDSRLYWLHDKNINPLSVIVIK